MQVTQKLAQFAANFDSSQIPESALSQAKAGIMDWLFVALAARPQLSDAWRNFSEQTLSQGGRAESTVLIRADRAT